MNPKTQPGKAPLQAKLSRTFTYLFLVGVLILLGLLWSATRLTSYGLEMSGILESTRRSYQIKSFLQEMETAYNNYVVTADPLDWDNFLASSNRLDDAVLQAQLDAEARGAENQDQARLDSLAQLQDYKKQFVDLAGQAAEAVDEEDQETVKELDDQIYEILPEMYKEVDAISEEGRARLTAAQEQMDTYMVFTLLAILAGVVIFVISIALVASVIANQINAPLIQLQDSLRQAEAGKFDPTSLKKLTERRDEVGDTAREFICMIEASFSQQDKLHQETEEIRAKIK